MPLPLALIAAVPGLIKAGYGISQMVRGNKGLKSLERPEYQIPEEELSRLALAQQSFASGQMPGASAMRDDVNASAANAASFAREGGSPLAALAAIQSRQQQGLRQVGIDNANYRDRQQQNYSAALADMGQQQDKAWQINKFAPYSDKYNEFREMSGAGMQNLFGGLDSLSAIGLDSLSAIGLQAFGNRVKPGEAAAEGLQKTAADRSFQSSVDLAKRGYKAGDAVKDLSRLLTTPGQTAPKYTDQQIEQLLDMLRSK